MKTYRGNVNVLLKFTFIHFLNEIERKKGECKKSSAKHYFYKPEEIKYTHLLRLISILC